MEPIRIVLQCPKCGEDQQQKVTFQRRPGNREERLKLTCPNCGFGTGHAQCADAEQVIQAQGNN